MLFDSLKKKLKYPFNRRDPKIAKLVYAGPERKPSVPSAEGDPVLDVYAGPEEPAPEERKSGGRIYAGPEFYGRRPKPSREEASAVYAGPEFFDKRPMPPEEEAKPVYAGPPPLPEDPLAPVYAGPEDFDMGERP